MNGMLLGVIALLAIMTILGYKKGFVKKLVGIVSWILTLSLVYIALPYIVAFLKQSTKLYISIQERVAGSGTEAMEFLRILGMETAASGFVADKLLKLIAFVVTVLLVSLTVHGISWALNLASKLPIIKGANRTVGAVVGFLEGLLLVWIAFLLIGVCGSYKWGAEAFRLILESELLTWLFAHNPLVILLLA